MPIRLDAHAASDVGAHRTVNQDAAFTASWAAAVADGVGGGPSGDLASAALVHRLVAGRGRLPDAAGLDERLREANWDLRALAERDGSLRGMATTFTGLFVGPGGELLLAHTGDSRAYLLRGGRFERCTRDDSYVQALVDSGVISAEDAASHPKRNIITASFGGDEDDCPLVREVGAQAGDRWMLCSDGLTDYVPEDAVQQAMRATSPAEAAAAAVGLALAASTRDNVTVVVCDIVNAGTAHDEPLFFGSAAERFREELESA